MPRSAENSDIGSSPKIRNCENVRRKFHLPSHSLEDLKPSTFDLRTRGFIHSLRACSCVATLVNQLRPDPHEHLDQILPYPSQTKPQPMTEELRSKCIRFSEQKNSVPKVEYRRGRKRHASIVTLYAVIQSPPKSHHLFQKILPRYSSSIKQQ